MTPYAEALALQEAAVAEVLAGGRERAYFVEHPPCFTTGTGAMPSELLDVGGIPVIPTGRGGKTTYHGPGQRVVYVIKDLRETRDLREHIANLQQWLIASLRELGVEGFATDDVGVWVKAGLQDDRVTGLQDDRVTGLQERDFAKIAAIGVRVRKWVAYHGIALNVNPDLTAYNRIVPCGLAKPVTSLAVLGCTASMADVDKALFNNLGRLQGPQ
ncbi:MAG: lipoyl(octanoyl) transferase [Alphaproteobacteria bacterium]